MLLAVVSIALLGSIAYSGPNDSPDLGVAGDAALTNEMDAGSTWDDSAIYAGLHPMVQKKISRLREKMATFGRRVYLMSGARRGPISASMHTQSLAVDVTIDYLDSEQVAEELRQMGFSCVITYFDRSHRPCHMAHGDLRGTTWAKGAYALGGRKAINCPEKAISLSEICDNSQKSQWIYSAMKKDPQRSVSAAKQRHGAMDHGARPAHAKAKASLVPTL